MTMDDILLYGGWLAFVPLFVWGARKYYYSKPRRFAGRTGANGLGIRAAASAIPTAGR